MIYRLIYCNRNGDSARIDIIKGALTPVETIEGTDNPFLLSYKMDTSNKSGFFMTSSANISVYESGTFNIDNLKTSSETELKVEYYINDVLFWSGFIIPDFFSRNIGVPATIEMVASDRIGTLKGSTLSSLTQYVTMRDIAVACLAKTGLSLPLLTMADFGNNGQTNAFFKSLGLSGRLSDTKGRNISCYDILRSILVACDGKLSQQDGAWYIVNKFQHETGSGNLFSSLTASTPYVEQSVPFSEVDTGARRTIIPVAATTGVYHEHGGGRKYPDNYNFADGLAGWTAKNGFVASIDNKKIDFYLFGAPSFSATETVPPYLLNNNQRILSGNSMDLVPYIESSPIAVKAVEADRVKVNIDISVTAPGGASHLTDPAAYPSFVRYAVIATNGPTKLALNRSGAFETYNPNSYETQTLLTHVRNTLDRASFADDISSAVSGTLIAGNDIANYNITIRIYGSGTYQTVLINQATITFSTTNSQLPKGTIYRRNQGAGFTSEYPTDTTIFGDYMSIGLNGYFYNYSIDDTSSLFSAPDILIQPKWTAHADANELPLLQHVARQRSRMFSIAHDLINASIDVEAFKPLSIFVDCNSKRYCVVSANFDFLRSKVEVEIEQISYASLEVREFIYSYFGDSDTGISSVGGISGGSTGTGTGGGMTAEQIEILNNLSSWWKLDSSDILYSDKNVRAPSFIGSLTGNADTATKLQTARTIAGVSFDGTANIAIPFANLSSKPTTLAGYGITDAYTKTEVDTALALKLNKSVFDDLFEKVEISTGVFAIKAKYTFFSTYGVSAYGPGTGGGGGGGSLSGLSDVMLTSLAANNLLQFNGTHWVNVPASSVGTPVSWGTTSNNTSPLTVSGTTKTLSLVGHLHAGVYEPVFSKNTAFNKNFGTTAGTVAEGNHTHSYLPLSGGTLTGTLTANNHIILPKGSHIYDTSTSDSAILVNSATIVGVGDIKSDTIRYLQLRGADVKFREAVSGAEYGIWHAGNFTPGNYLPLSGGTMTNTNVVTNLNADLLDGNHGTFYNHRVYSDADNYLGGHYTPGGIDKPNSAVFGRAKLKLAMLAGSNIGGNATGLYYDTLWISSYIGGDVKLGTALHFDKYSQNIYFTKQDYDAANWGVAYRFWTDANLSPVTTNTVQTITAQKTFSDGDANYGINAKPSIILGGNNTTNAGAIKLWGNVAGAYGLLQQATTNTFLDSSSGEVFINNYAAGNVRLVMGGGNVGIGMIPTVKLDVNGAIKSNAGIFSTNTAGSSIIQASTSGVSGFIALKSATTSTVNYIPCIQAVSSQANYGMYLTSEGFDSYGMSAFYFSARNAVGTGAVTSGKIFSINNYATERFNIDINGDTTTSRAFRSDSNLGGLTTPIGTGWSQIWGMQGYELTNATTPNTNFFGIATQYFNPTRHIGFFGQGLENAWIGLHDGSAWFKGNVTSNSEILAGGGLRVNQTSYTGIGISLRGTHSAVNPVYGLMFASIATKGSHGAVTGDYATYFTMDGVANRGWIFTSNAGGTTGNVASISNTGTIVASGGITAYTASDKRFKTDIRDITTGLNTVMKLNPVMYSYNSLAKGLNATLPDFDYGLIAQDVKDIMPDIVHSMFNGEYLGIDYIKLIPILISAIKEQQSQISELRKMLNA